MQPNVSTLERASTGRHRSLFDGERDQAEAHARGVQGWASWGAVAYEATFGGHHQGACWQCRTAAKEVKATARAPTV